ncbi:Coatomer complex beta subunit [Spraguea lophii 42_110]|uniref:Coatomer complex beta subunit n=1 Tax=Spraguea lophii (strain 42_110) TaxID=1358809 RepID=S7WAA5_SPRLO|nr:Coatomer complex beta subunit [Spraguea lophii 42_110]
MKDLYVSLSSLPPKEEIIQNLGSKKEEKKILAMQSMVALMSQGIDFSDYVGVTVKEIIPFDKNKDLKRLFYYYLELMNKVDKKGRILAEMLLVTNQIRKDISNPNEYVRSLAMRFASKLEEYEIVEILLKPIRDNLTHFHADVRKNAFYCLAEIYKKFKENFTEIPELIFERLTVEGDCGVLIQGYISLKEINDELFQKFNRKIKVELQEPVFLEILIDNLNEIKMLEKLSEMKNIRVALKSSIKLLEKAKQEKKKKEIAMKIISLIPQTKDTEILDSGSMIIMKNSSFFKGETQQFLSICNTFNRIEKFIDFLLEISDSQDYILLEDFLLEKFHSLFNQTQKVFILQKLQKLSECSYSNKTLELLRDCVIGNNPELAFESVNFLSKIKNVDILIQGLKATKFGKVFRSILSTLSELIEYPMVLYDLIKEIIENEQISDNIFNSFRDPSKIFFGADLALALSTNVKLYEKHNNLENEKHEELKAEIEQLLIQIIKIGKEINSIDKNSYNMIIICIKNIKQTQEDAHIEELEEKVLFDKYFILPQQKKEKKIIEEEFTKEKVFQLTGLSDHLFIEAKLNCTVLSIDLEILVVNQTNNLLQNVTFDFTTSNNIQENFTIQPFLLKPRTAKNLTFSFCVTEIFNSFITGTVIFNFSDKGTLKDYVLNLSEIKILLSDFLHPANMSDSVFRNKWVGMEWENTYTYRFNTMLSLHCLLNEISKHLKANVIRTEKDEEFIVANLCTTTLQGEEILINLTLQKNEMINFDCRIRSNKEVLVKALTTVLGDCLREVK